MKKIKEAIERNKKALRLKHSLGKETKTSIIRIMNGLSCEVEEGNWKLKVDMPVSIGGNNMGPTPGVYGRAALGSCLAVGYMMKAAELNIPIETLEVEIQVDLDNGALLGTADKNIPPGYLEVRYSIKVTSDASEDNLVQVFDEGDAHSPYLDIFRRAQKCVRTIDIHQPKYKL